MRYTATVYRCVLVVAVVSFFVFFFGWAAGNKLRMMGYAFLFTTHATMVSATPTTAKNESAVSLCVFGAPGVSLCCCSWVVASPILKPELCVRNKQCDVASARHFCWLLLLLVVLVVASVGVSAVAWFRVSALLGRVSRSLCAVFDIFTSTLKNAIRRA